MSESPSTPTTHVVYQANQPMLQSVQNVRNMLHHTARQHIGKKVQVQNIDGQVWEGVIISADRGILYLQVTPMHGYPEPRALFGPTILPLVLYELLVITLLM